MEIKEIKRQLSNKECDERLSDLYLDEKLIEYQRNRYLNALDKFVENFSDGDVSIISTSGRCEVGGNHTDHQHGKVLGCAINLDLIAVVRKNDDININSDGLLINIKNNQYDYSQDELSTSKALVKGICHKFIENGYKVGGFDAYITSDVLVGSGMSSSAAFEMGVAAILNYLYNDNQIDALKLSKIAQYSENKYFGKPCGLLDQAVIGQGGLVFMDFKDVNNIKVEKLNVEFDKFGYSLCVVNTKGSHHDLTAEYDAVTKEMKLVANYFNKEYISEIDYQEFIKNISSIREKISDRAILRSLHVIQENIRVDNEVDGLLNNDISKFLTNVNESGNSSFKYLQNVFSTSDYQHQGISIGLNISEQILKDKGVVRVHGGGFAGTMLAFVKNDFVEQYKRDIENVFGKDSCNILKVRKYGSKVVI